MLHYEKSHFSARKLSNVFFSFRITMIPSISCYTFISFDIITVVSAKKVTHCNTSFYFIIFLIHLFLFFIIFFTLAY